MEMVYPLLLPLSVSHARLLLSLWFILGKIPCSAPGPVTLLSTVLWIRALDKDLEEGKQTEETLTVVNTSRLSGSVLSSSTRDFI